MNTILDMFNFFLISMLGSIIGTTIVMLMFLDSIVKTLVAKASEGIGHGIAKGIDDYYHKQKKKHEHGF